MTALEELEQDLIECKDLVPMFRQIIAAMVQEASEAEEGSGTPRIIDAYTFGGLPSPVFS